MIKLIISIFVTLTTLTSFAYTPGQVLENGDVFLHYEASEGVYGDNWIGKKVYFDSDKGFLTVIIKGEGKHADFEGTAVVDCNGSYTNWITAKSFFENTDRANEIVPLPVMSATRKFLCQK